jgi:hypothetical protein
MIPGMETLPLTTTKEDGTRKNGFKPRICLKDTRKDTKGTKGFLFAPLGVLGVLCIFVVHFPSVLKPTLNDVCAARVRPLRINDVRCADARLSAL